jgi:hypothetical protein
MISTPMARLAALILAASPTAGRSDVLDLTFHAGADRYGVVDLKTGLSGSDFTDAQRMRDTSATLGATALFRLGLLEAGALAEVGRPGRDNTTSAVAALGGVGFELGRLRLDLLGELGGHRYADALSNPSVIVDANRADWLAYAGIRPGLSLLLGERRGFLIGLWTFARWDLTRKEIPVTLSGLGGSGAYDLGGPQHGVALRIGFAL